MSGLGTRRYTAWSLYCGEWKRSEHAAHHVIGWEVTQQSNRPAICCIELRGAKDVPVIGDHCRLSVSDTEIFTGTIHHRTMRQDAGGVTTVRLLAIDPLGNAANRQQVRRLSGTTRDIISTLAQASVRGATGINYEHLYQTEQADLDLIIQCCEQSGLCATYHDDAVALFPFSGDERSPRIVTLGNEVRSYTRSEDVYVLPATITSTGWTTATSSALRASSARLNAAHTQGERWILGLQGDAPDVLQGRADNEAGRRAAHADAVNAIVDGDPTWSPGQRFSINGIDADNQTWVCHRVHHRLRADSGYVCEIDSAPPPVTPIERRTRLMPAIISAIDDPDKRGRVQVRYPTYGDLESPWLPAAMAGLGQAQGLSCTYSVDDWVIVAVTAQDLGDAIVLGGIPAALASDAAPRDGGKHVLHVRTPGGQRLQLDDKARSLSLRTNDGHVIELKPGELELTAAGDLTIQAPGRRITITAASIDFRQG